MMITVMMITTTAVEVTVMGTSNNDETEKYIYHQSSREL